MERYGKYMAYTHDEILDMAFGLRGTDEREAFESESAEDIRLSLEQLSKERATKGLPPEFTEEELTCDDIEEEMEVEMEMA